MKSLTPEMIEKAKAAKSAEEMLELAKANGVEMTADEAKIYYAQLNPKSGELDDDDLDAVAGGACATTALGRVRITSGQCCPKCGGTIGIVNSLSGSTPFIDCEKCNVTIVRTIDCTYEVID